MSIEPNSAALHRIISVFRFSTPPRFCATDQSSCESHQMNKGGVKMGEPRQYTKFSLFVQPSSLIDSFLLFCFSTHKTLNVIIIHGHLVIPLLLFIYFIHPTMVFEVSIFANGLIFQFSIKRLTHCAKPSREQSVRLWGIGLAIFP